MNQTIGVSITPQSVRPTLHYSQGDVGRVFVINVTGYDIPPGATVTCVATKPSGMGFTVNGTVSGNTVTFTSTAEMTDEWGRFPAEIRIASGSTLLGTANFLMVGEKDPHPASTIDGTQEELIPQLTLLVNRVEAAAESVHDLTVSATTLAAGSDATATYDSTNNSIAFGIPRGADGDVTRAEFNDLKSDISSIADVKTSPNLFDENAISQGYLTSNGNISVTGDWATSDFIPVEYGKNYNYSASANGARGHDYIYFRIEYDSSKSIISGTYAQSGATVYTPISENAKYVRFSTHWLDTVTDRCFQEGTELTYSEYGAKEATILDASNSENVRNLVEAVPVIRTANLFDYNAVKSGYINNINGEIRASDNWIYSDFIPVEYGKQYVLYNTTSKYALYFVQELDENKVGVSYENSVQTPYTPSTTTVKYLRFCEHPTGIENLVFEEGTQAKGIYIPFGKTMDAPYKNLLYGKKWVALGDSLTEKNVSATSNYTDFISTNNSMELVNMGVGGTGYMRGYDGNNAFYQRAENIPSCDIITIFGSGNDLAYYSDLGVATDSSTDTICGCINETLDVIFANHPTTPLLVIAPTPWAGNTPDMTTGMALYCERLKEICSMRGVAYLDLFHHSGLRPNDTVQRDLVFYNGSLDGHGDYVHPNKLGHSIIAPRIMQAMESVIQFFRPLNQ